MISNKYLCLLVYIQTNNILALIFSLLSCSMNSSKSKKNDKINNVQFNILKKSGVKINQ